MKLLNKYEDMKLERVQYENSYIPSYVTLEFIKFENNNLIEKRIKYNLHKVDNNYSFKFSYDREQDYKMRSIIRDEFKLYGYDDVNFENINKYVGYDNFTVYEYDLFNTLSPKIEFIDFSYRDIGNNYSVNIYRIIDDGNKFEIMAKNNNNINEYRKATLLYAQRSAMNRTSFIDEDIKEFKLLQLKEKLFINLDKIKCNKFFDKQDDNYIKEYDVNINAIFSIKEHDGLPYIDFKIEP